MAERVGRGERTRAVAAALHLSPRTVESHLASVYRKLGVSSRSELIVVINGGIVASPPLQDMAMPAIRYARSGARSIAYQVFGDGEVDIIMVPGLASHLEMLWEQIGWRRFVTALGAIGRLIVFDKRGTGLSDPVDLDEPLTLDQRMTDTEAVLDAVGSGRSVMFGLSEGGPMGLYAAIARPDRVGALLVYGSAVLDSPHGRERRRRLVSLAEASYGSGLLAAKLWPSMARTEEGRAWLARYERHASSPGMITRLMAMNIDIDLSPIIHLVRQPVTIVHNVDDPAVPFQEAERLAAALPHARLVRLVRLNGVDHVPWGEIELDPLGDALRDLVGQVESGITPTTVLRAVVAVVGVAPADQRRAVDWLTSCGGRTTVVGAGVVAVLDSLHQAMRCATALARMLPAAGVAVHSGEVREGPDEVAGAAVDEAVALAGGAAAGQPSRSPVVDLLGSE